MGSHKPLVAGGLSVAVDAIMIVNDIAHFTVSVDFARPVLTVERTHTISRGLAIVSVDVKYQLFVERCVILYVKP
jgi:hypothetical protein